MVIYLLGPSGVGKTSCARHAAETLAGVDHRDLDELCQGRQFDWGHCESALLTLEDWYAGHAPHALVDIGAGIETLSQLVSFLRPRRKSAVLFWAPADEVFPRNAQGPGRRFDDFIDTEYRTREMLYALPAYRLNVSGLRLDESRVRFVDLLRELLGIGKTA